MVDVLKVAAHLGTGAREDWDVADELVQRGRFRHGLFFAHLAIEKALKPKVCLATDQLAPRIHDLLRLSELAQLSPDGNQRDTLARMNAYALVGRYPDTLGTSITREVAEARLAEASQGGVRVVDESTVRVVRTYLRTLCDAGIPAERGVLFGSHARGEAREWSDIDLVVLSPRFDQPYSVADVERLWVAAGRTDSRIEPIPCGERQWIEDDASEILEIARREGQSITLDDRAA